MELNLTPIINFDGKKMDIDAKVDVSAEECDFFSVLEPVKVCGSVRNIGGTIEIEAVCEAKLEMICDRCAGNFVRELGFKLFEQLKKETADVNENDSNPDIIYFSGNQVNLSELVYAALYSSLPSKILCREDCKGLCTECGASLNEGDCGCDTRTVDPRFEILNSIDI